MSLELLESLLLKLTRIEAISKTVQSNVAASECTAIHARVESDLLSQNILGAVLFKVPQDYYERTLSARAAILASPADRLCKTLILENVASSARAPRHSRPLALTRDDDLSTSRYVAVVVPYLHKLDMDALTRCIRASAPGGNPAVKLVHASDGDIISGFPFNGVSIFGGKVSMPVVLCKVLFEAPSEPYIWLGGGEADLKLRVPTPQLAPLCHIFDCSVARARDCDDE